MADNSAIAVKLQQLANEAQIKVQQLSNQATEKTMQYNTQEANAARTWQKMMSDTSHQREVKDLIAAGLNPVLSSGGAGAQSYTTSSANAQAENAAAAYSAIAGSQINTLGGIEQSRINAAATRAAARQQAAAVRAAAAAQAQAARYAAAMNYETNKYRADKAYEQAEMQAKWAYKTALEKPVSSLGGVIDKFLSNAGVYGAVRSTLGSAIRTYANKILNNPGNYFVNRGTVTKNNFTLNKQGIGYVNRGLSKLDLPISNYSRKLYIKAFVFGDLSARKSLSNMLAIQQRRKARAYDRVVTRSGYTWKSSI